MRPFTIVLIAFVILTLLMCLGAYHIPEAIFHLLTGWFWFLKRSAENASISISGILTALFCGLTSWIGIHFLIVQKISSKNSSLPHWKFSGLVTASVVILFVAGVSLVASVHQVTWLFTSPEPWTKSNFHVIKRVESRNNLRRIGSAQHDYFAENQSFTVGGTFDESGHGLHSWETFLLPYLDEQELFNKIDLKRSWKTPEQAQIFTQQIEFFQNPMHPHSVNGSKTTESHYALNSHIAGVNHSSSKADIPDGTSHTLFAGEIKYSPRSWGDPFNFRDPILGFNRRNGFGSVWPSDGVQFLMTDGSTRMISSKVAHEVLKALSTPDGGEGIMDSEF